MKDGKPLTISLLGVDILGIGKGLEYLNAQWNQAGITVDLRTPEYSTYSQSYKKSDWDAVIAAIPLDQGNPNRAALGFSGKPPPAGSNAARTNNPVLESSFAAAEASVGAERCKNWATFQQTLFRNYDVWPLASPKVYWFTKGIDVFPGAQAANLRYIRKAAS